MTFGCVVVVSDYPAKEVQLGEGAFDHPAVTDRDKAVRVTQEKAAMQAEDATVSTATNATIEAGQKAGAWVSEKAQKLWNWRPWN